MSAEPSWRERLRRELRERELSDYLSPILVKEARQGVRGSAFVASFLLLQGLMALSLIAAVLDPRSIPNQASTFLFWMSVAVPAMAVLPLSGLTALSSERELGTLEPMLLTRLSAQRVIAGKWAAIAAQIGLLFTAVLPYVLLRYFLGGVDLGGELLHLFQLGLSSTLVSALAVGISASRISSLFRMLVVLALGIPIHGAIQGVMELGARGVPVPGIAPTAALLLLWALSVQIALDSGATALAPSVESSSTRVRLLALAAVPVVWYAAPGGRGTPDSRVLLAFWAGLLLITVVTAALAERRREPAELDAGFFGAGRLRALCGAFVAPGWPSATLFATLVVTTLMALTATQTGEPALVLVPGLALLATLLQPVALSQRIAPGVSRRGSLYAALFVASVGVSLCGELLVALIPGLPRSLPDLTAALSPLVYVVRRGFAPWQIVGAAELAPSDLLFAAVAVASPALALIPAIRALRERRRDLRPRHKASSRALGDPARA